MRTVNLIGIVLDERSFKNCRYIFILIKEVSFGFLNKLPKTSRTMITGGGKKMGQNKPLQADQHISCPILKLFQQLVGLQSERVQKKVSKRKRNSKN